MRNVVCVLVAVAAGCGIQNKVAPDGGLIDGVVTGDGSDTGSGSAAELTITLTDKPATLGNAANVSFQFTTSIPATTQCKADNEAFHDCASPLALASLADGMHTFDVNATAGDQHAAIPTYSFAVDTIAPAMMITGQPPASSPVATAQFYFQKDDSTTVTCQLDSTAAAPCTSPVMYSGLADGMHTFTVTGTDGAGNTNAAMYTWTIDTTTPAVAITTEPPNPSTSSTATFDFTIGNSVTVTCQLDSAAPATCTGTSKSYTGLADGAHTFTLRGTNSAGTTTTRTYTWTIDATPPSVTIDSAPAAVTNATTAQFQFTVTGATTTTCQLDTGTPATCTSPWTYTGLTDGAHTFTLTAVDGAGNTTTKTKNWTVDTVAPTVTITSTPPDPSTSASAQFAFMATGASAVTCQIDSASATACTTSASYSGLADGSHTFTVRAIDAATNSTTRSYTWTVDTTAPVLSITSAPSGTTNMTSAQISFTATGATTVTCQLDGGSPAACMTSVSYTGLADGSHTFTLRGTDGAGNTATKTASWTVDTAAPIVALTSYPSDPSTSANAVFQFNVTGATTITCQIDSVAPAACTNAANYSGLADGLHTFTVQATDGAGNTASKAYSWNIDTTAPTVTFTSTPPTLTNSTSASFAFMVTGATTITCQLDGGAPNNCTSSFSTTGLSSTQHTFTVRGTDGAGNTGSQSYTWTIDTTPPTVSITLGPGATSNSRSASVWFDASDPAVCKLDSGAWSACSTRVDYTGLADGTHTFYVTDTDGAGNTASAQYTWTIDATAPSVAGLGYNCDLSTGYVTVSWTASDAHSITQTCAYPNGANSGPCNNGWSGYLSGSASTWSLAVTDSFGNTTNKSLTIKSTVCQ